MIKRRILYLLILAVLSWLMIMYVDVYIEGIFAAAVLLPVICIILKYAAIFFIKVSWASNSVKTMQGTPVKIRAVVRNRFFLPLNSVTITFETEDALGNKEQCSLATNLMPKMERHCVIELCPNYAGPVSVRLKAVKINDILGLSAVSKKRGALLSLIVEPKPCECIPVTVEAREEYKEDGDEYSAYASGQDKSQIFDMSPYKEGSSVKDIHWKLSAKTQELMVKRYGYPVEKGINVLVDYARPDGKVSAAGISWFFGQLFAFLDELEKSGQNISIYAFTGTENECIRINDKDDLLYLDINNSCHPDTVCDTFIKMIGTKAGVLISSRLSESDVSAYDGLSDYYVSWNALCGDKENAVKELFVEEAKIIGMSIMDIGEEKNPAVSFGEELFINRDNESTAAYTHLFRMLIILIGSIVPCLIFYDVLMLYDGTPLRVIIYGVLAAVLMLISAYIKNRGLRLLYMIAGLAAAVFSLGIGNIANGAVNVVKAFGNTMYFYGDVYGLVMDYSRTIECFVALASFLYAVILFAFTWKSISVIIHMVLTVPPVALCLVYGCVPKGIYVVLYAAYISGVLVYSITYRNIVKSEKRVRKKAYYESTINIGAILSYTAMLITAVILIINTAKGYNRPELFDNIKAAINEKIDAFSLEYTTITENLAEAGMNEGELGTADNVIYSGDTVLTVTVSGDLTFPMYLKSYIGSVYTGSSWETVGTAAVTKIDTILSSAGFNNHDAYNLPYYIMGGAGDYLLETGTGRVYSGSVSIEAVDTSDTNYYIPYWAYISPDIRFSDDGALINNVYGERSYQIYQLEGIDSAYKYIDLACSGENRIYLQWEEVYRDVAYEYYAAYDGSAKAEERLMQEMPWEYTLDGITYNLGDGVQNIGYEPYIEAVRDYLESNYEYSLSVEKLESGEDFIEEFMKSGTGYCTHFATLATEMFRLYGIPARYVEGYYVKPDSVSMAKYYESAADFTIEVQDKNAHAWAEIYVDGLGFVPVETTPGYTGISYTYEENETKAQTVNNAQENTEEEETTTLSEEAYAEEEESPTADEEQTTAYDKENDEQDESDKNLSEATNKRKYAAAIILIFAAIVGVLGRKRFIEHKNRKIMLEGSQADVAYMWRGQIVKMIGCIKEPSELNGSETSKGLADEILKRTLTGSRLHEKMPDSKEIKSMLSIFDKEMYSEAGTKKQEMAQAVFIAKHVVHGLYNSQSKVRKLYIKYIKCLYLR